MGTVIPIDFQQRRRACARPGGRVLAGMHGQDMAMAIGMGMGMAVCVACLACLHAPLLMLWRPWLPSSPPRTRRNTLKQ